jgi:hypothetical protein
MRKAFWLQQYHDNNRSRAKKEYKTSEINVGLPNQRNDRQLDLCRARDGCAGPPTPSSAQSTLR